MANAAHNPKSNPTYTYAGSGARSEHSAYVEQIKNYPVLSGPAERRLVRRWYTKGDRAAYDSLIGSHLRLVPKMAQKYSGYGVPIADLIGEGNIGLLQSAERFDLEKVFAFPPMPAGGSRRHAQFRFADLGHSLRWVTVRRRNACSSTYAV